MNLKESFRYQNYLTTTLNGLNGVFFNGEYALRTVQEHLRSKANPEAQDETIDLTQKGRVYPYNLETLVDFGLHLLREKEDLTKAISEAKRSLDIDIDAGLACNKVKMDYMRVLKRAMSARESERTFPGYGYKFNAEGNQVQYVYDIVETKTLDYDKSIVRSIYNELNKECDSVSTEVDKAMVNLEVDFTPFYDVNDGFEEALDFFVYASQKADADYAEELKDLFEE